MRHFARLFGPKREIGLGSLQVGVGDGEAFVHPLRQTWPRAVHESDDLWDLAEKFARHAGRTLDNGGAQRQHRALDLGRRQRSEKDVAVAEHIERRLAGPSGRSDGQRRCSQASGQRQE